MIVHTILIQSVEKNWKYHIQIKTYDQSKLLTDGSRENQRSQFRAEHEQKKQHAQHCKDAQHAHSDRPQQDRALGTALSPCCNSIRSLKKLYLYILQEKYACVEHSVIKRYNFIFNIHHDILIARSHPSRNFSQNCELFPLVIS